jgi:hypothetical protein
MIYNWTSYPLTCLLELVWQSAQSALQAKKRPKTTAVELCACLERALNYMHTGNAAVITTSLMNPLWIGPSVVQDGLPSLNSVLIPAQSTTCIVIDYNWPHNGKGQPRTASKASQIRNYGEGHFNVSSYIQISTGLVWFTVTHIHTYMILCLQAHDHNITNAHCRSSMLDVQADVTSFVRSRYTRTSSIFDLRVCQRLHPVRINTRLEYTRPALLSPVFSYLIQSRYLTRYLTYQRVEDVRPASTFIILISSVIVSSW